MMFIIGMVAAVLLIIIGLSPVGLVFISIGTLLWLACFSKPKAPTMRYRVKGYRV